MPKLTLADIIPGSGERRISSFQVDSRQVAAGDLFFALAGAKADGHDYLAQARGRGAIGAVVSNAYKGPDHGLLLLRVDDVLKTLQELANKKFKQIRPEIVCGVTGSIGKTTTKEFLRTLLSMRYKVAASPGNANSQIGLPLAILNGFSGDEGVAVLEMAMTKPGQIRRLIDMAAPDIALITTVQLVHAQAFGSIEEISWAKAEIFSSPQTRLGIIPYDLPAKAEIAKLLPTRTFSTVHPEADFFLKVVEGRLVFCEGAESVVLGNFRLAGGHNKHNLLAALVVARACGLSWPELIDGLPLLELPERRLQRLERNGVTLINDSYNACEASVKSALESLAVLCPGAKRRIAVLGPVPELGKFSEACHKAIGHHALDHLDLLFCLGDACLPIVQEWRSRGRQVEYFEEKKDLSAAVCAVLQPGDVVLLKGANYVQLWTLVEDLLR